MKFSNFWKPLDPTKTKIRNHRSEDHLPFSVSPWKKDEIGVQGSPNVDEEKIVSTKQSDTIPTLQRRVSSYRSDAKGAEENENVVAHLHSEPASNEENDDEESPVEVPEEDKWSDLLLELTLATAYANIMENTPVTNGISAFSFLAFFALLWWTWASQVAYNVRFRTKDWLHRVFAILQFVIFCAMATFTSNFNILFGLIADEESTPVGPVDFHAVNFNDVFASSLREERLPVINAKGISLVMMFSRLFLLVQYLIVYSSARHTSHTKYQPGLVVHLVTLSISTLAYLIAFAVMSSKPSKAENGLKVVLWFLPVFLEMSSYFYILKKFPGAHVKYETERIFTRSSTLFIVILGEGLNQVTGSFKFIVGALGFTARGVVIIVSAGAVIIGELSLYFRNNWDSWRGQKRTLLWFYAHYFYMAALILTLQSVRYLLSFANLYAAISDLLNLAIVLEDETLSKQLTSVTADQFPDGQNAFIAIGLPFGDFINVVNEYISSGRKLNPTAATKAAQTLLYVACVTFNEFAAFPDPGTTLYNDVQTFMSQTLIPINELNTTYKLLGELLSARLQSAFWFWGVAGGTLIMLSVMSILKAKPADKYETISIMLRFGLGVVYLLFSGLTFGHNQSYFSNWMTAEDNLKTSTAWRIASSAYLIPSFAITLLIINCIEIYLGRKAMRLYDEYDKSIKAQSGGNAQGDTEAKK